MQPARSVSCTPGAAVLSYRVFCLLCLLLRLGYGLWLGYGWVVAEQRAGEQFSKFEPVVMARQVVAGTNYLFKVEVGDDRFAHVRVRAALPLLSSERCV